MSLADALSRLENDPLCKMGELIADLDPSTREVLERVMASQASSQSIWGALKNEGYKIGKTTVGLHRSGKCSCKGTYESL